MTGWRWGYLEQLGGARRGQRWYRWQWKEEVMPGHLGGWSQRDSCGIGSKTGFESLDSIHIELEREIAQYISISAH